MLTSPGDGRTCSAFKGLASELPPLSSPEVRKITTGEAAPAGTTGKLTSYFAKYCSVSGITASLIPLRRSIAGSRQSATNCSSEPA